MERDPTVEATEPVLPCPVSWALWNSLTPRVLIAEKPHSIKESELIRMFLRIPRECIAFAHKRSRSCLRRQKGFAGIPSPKRVLTTNGDRETKLSMSNETGRVSVREDYLGGVLCNSLGDAWGQWASHEHLTTDGMGTQPWNGTTAARLVPTKAGLPPTNPQRCT